MSESTSQKRWVAVALVLLAAGAASINGKAVQPDRPDFSGTWVAEPETAPAAGPAAPAAAAPVRGSMGSGWGSPITITQTAAQMVVEHPAFSRYDLQPPLRHVYALDGSETSYPIMISHTTQIRRARAVWKGATLEITTTYPGRDPMKGTAFTVDVVQRLSLEPGGTLVVEVTRNGALGGSPTSSRTLYRKG
jgi:hypothetical protein